LIRDALHHCPLVEEAADFRDNKVVDTPRVDGQVVLFVLEGDDTDPFDSEFLAETRHDGDAFAILRRERKVRFYRR
jgi:hypothetical protein